MQGGGPAQAYRLRLGSGSLTTFVYAALAAGLLTAVAGSVARAWWYARHPLHLRWELYPVPHEAPERAAHGGSYFEAAEWWRTPRRTDRGAELRFMAREILFLHALRMSNRRLWYRSFPFHAGLYLVLAAGSLLAVAAVASAAGGALAGTAGAALCTAYTALGWAGVLLTIGGAGALAAHRMRDAALRSSTTPGDLFNLGFFVAALGLLAAGRILGPPGAPDLLAIATGLLTWDTSLRIPTGLGSGLVACAALAAYIPMTHMSHFIGKYFTYHAVRWDDRPMADQARMSAEIATYLTYRPTWAAPHVGADGRRSWGEVAAAEPDRERAP